MNSIDDLADKLGQLSITEVLALTKRLEGEWGVSATPVAAPQRAPGPPPPPVEVEASSYAVRLLNPGAGKMGVIKLVRELTALGLKEAKDLVDGAPASAQTLKTGLAKSDADAMLARLKEAGADADLQAE